MFSHDSNQCILPVAMQLRPYYADKQTYNKEHLQSIKLDFERDIICMHINNTLLNLTKSLKSHLLHILQ